VADGAAFANCNPVAAIMFLLRVSAAVGNGRTVSVKTWCILSANPGLKQPKRVPNSCHGLPSPESGQQNFGC